MSGLPDLFGATFLINLPERLDRLKSAKMQLARAGWEIGPPSVKIFAALRYAEPAGFPSAPIRGCFQSHLRCLRLAHEKSVSSVLIIEDDIALSTALPRMTSSIRARLSTHEWDFVYFGHYGTGEIPAARRDTNEGDLSFDEWTGEILTTYFYGVSARILPRLIAHLNNIENGLAGDQNSGPMPIDGAYNIFRRNNPDVRCLIARPKLGWQRPSRSDITPQTIDGITAMWPVVSALRRLKYLASRWHS
jgi:glycosyl transferase family 25